MTDQLDMFALSDTEHRLSNVEDIDRTIEFWEGTGVDYCDVWWALGKRSICQGGWPQVREHMRLYANRLEYKRRQWRDDKRRQRAAELRQAA